MGRSSGGIWQRAESGAERLQRLRSADRLVSVAQRHGQYLDGGDKRGHCAFLDKQDVPLFLPPYFSLFVGAVPLYAGDPQAGVWFEPQSFVDCICLSVQEIASAIKERVDISAQVSRRRETLCLVSFEEMEHQTMAFHRRALLKS